MPVIFSANQQSGAANNGRGDASWTFLDTIVGGTVRITI
jgi:hypothetical protein